MKNHDMATNYYLFDPHSPQKRGKHLGKRYARGIYCWDCKQLAESVPNPKGAEWFCVFCGEKRLEDETFFNPAFRELGFDKSPASAHEGINGAMGFIWALGENGLGSKTVKDAKDLVYSSHEFINEYGDKLTQEDMKAILEECLIEEVSFELFS